MNLIRKIFFKSTVYVTVQNNRFDLLRVEDSKTLTVRSTEPFDNVRQAIANFQLAEVVLCKAFKDLYDNKIWLASPVVIMHQLVKTEGGLSQVEKRVLAELALSAGGKEFHIWEGPRLTIDQIKNKEYL